MEKPIRVLFLDNIMDRGGAQAMVMNYYRNIDRTKVQFDFLVHRDIEGAYDKEIKQLGGHIYNILPPYPQNYFKYSKKINEFFDNHPEYHILHASMTETALFAFIQAEKRNIPVRICHAHTARFKKSFRLKEIIRKLYLVGIRKYSTHYFACGEAAGRYVFGDSKNVYYIHNAIDTALFSPNKDIESSVRKEMGLNDQLVIGHVGRFEEPKNHVFLIDIFYEIQKIKADAVLVLVGSVEKGSKYEQEIKNRIKQLKLDEKVIFTGPRNDVNRLLQAFNAFVLPSLWEGLPLVIVEAQTVGLKCFISDKVSTECIMTNNVEVISLDDSAEKWANIIIRNISKDKDFYAVRDVVNNGYDIRENAEWLQKFYLEQQGVQG